jgi:hypothetical protein
MLLDGAYLGEEKCIPARIPLDFFLVVFLGIEFLPHAGWENVFVTFVPAAINDFRECCVVSCAFEIHFWGCVFGWLGL